MRIIYFFLASGLGAVTRYLIDSQLRLIYKFPIGILLVNVTGSFLLGLIIGSNSDLIFALIGFCGALTTWSAFAIDLDDARINKRNKEFFLNIAGNYGLAITAMLLGRWISG
ncbi:MAG: CrcB family protein [Actinobacteria bacterium]|nr:CrcB family protein [Actinomycetota bacterium]